MSKKRRPEVGDIWNCSATGNPDITPGTDYEITRIYAVKGVQVCDAKIVAEYEQYQATDLEAYELRRITGEKQWSWKNPATEFEIGDRVVYMPGPKKYGNGRTATVVNTHDNTYYFSSAMKDGFLAVAWDDMGDKDNVGGAMAKNFRKIEVNKEHKNEYGETVVDEYKRVIEI